MTRPLRLAALALAALAGCGEDAAAPPGLLLAEPSAVAAFRGFTTKSSALHPYLAIANAVTNDLTIVDAVDDTMVPAPVPLRPLVVPVAGRPALLASARFAETEERPDLLVAVSAGGSELQVIRTWTAANGVAGTIDLGGDVLALVEVPTAPSSGTARLAAALSGGRVAVVTFSRSAGDAIDVAGATVATGALGFQPVALAGLPGDQGRIWAASPDMNGVARIDLAPPDGQPSPGTVLDAGAPTRLVAAARLAERGPGEAGLEPATWSTLTPSERVYAVLDESGCGLDAPIPCGLVALDANGTGFAPDFAGTLPGRAPIPIPGRALALAASGPPALPPSQAPADQIYAPPFMRMASALGARATTGVAAVASSDGALYYVDLGRWDLPSEQLVHRFVGATPAPAGTGAAADQWLVLEPELGGSPISHLDGAALAAAVTVTPGFTPTARWTITHEGVLPGLSSRRAQAGHDGRPWLALQSGTAGAFTEVVRLHDPTLGVRPGDTVVVEPAGLGTCTAPFEVTVDDLVQPISSALYPGGAVHLAEKDPANGAWHSCFSALTGPVAGLRATFRAGGTAPYAVVRGTGTAALHVGRATPGERFTVAASDEGAFAACSLPPRQPWPTNPDTVSCDPTTCRPVCEALLRARLGRRTAYVPERCDAACLARWPGGVTDVAGPAVAFTVALETAATPPRDLALVVETRDGRAPLRAVDPLGPGVDARSVVPFDRSRYVPAAGVRFLVPYVSGVVLDASPTSGSVGALR